MDAKRLEQLKEAWIKNVCRIMGLEKDKAELMYNKIQPYNK